MPSHVCLPSLKVLKTLITHLVWLLSPVHLGNIYDSYFLLLVIAVLYNDQSVLSLASLDVAASKTNKKPREDSLGHVSDSGYLSWNQYLPSVV
jgi:hypothetical protein